MPGSQPSAMGWGLSAAISAEECNGSICTPPMTRQPVMLNGHKLQPKLRTASCCPLHVHVSLSLALTAVRAWQDRERAEMWCHSQ